MYTYEDARTYRRRLALPLQWPGDGPPPPRDRVEFTRLVMNCAYEAGLGYPNPYRLLCETGDEAKVRDFQERIGRYTGQTSERIVPTHLSLERHEDGRAWPLALRWTWAEYLPVLEGDYYLPWRDACQRGRGWYSDAGVTRDFWERVAPYLNERSGAKRDADELRTTYGSRRIKDCLKPEAFSLLDSWVRSRIAHARPVIVRERDGGRFLPGLFWLVTIVGGILSVSGALAGLYPFWLLFVLVPASAAFGFAVAVFHANFYIPKWHYPEPDLTFDELAARLVADRQRQWAEIEQIYGVPPDPS